MKSQGKPDIVGEFSILFIQVRVDKLFSQQIISFNYCIGKVVCKVVALLVVGKCELYALHCEITGIMCITYLLQSIFCTSFCKYVK